MDNFHPLEVVARGSETQLQVGENLNKTTLRGKDKKLPLDVNQGISFLFVSGSSFQQISYQLRRAFSQNTALKPLQFLISAF